MRHNDYRTYKPSYIGRYEDGAYSYRRNSWKTIVYLSGPISNVPDAKEKFEIWEKVFVHLGFEVLNPFSFEHKDPDDRLRVLQEDFDYLDTASLIFFMSGWQEAKGCNAEWGYAIAQDIPCLYEDETDGGIFDKEDAAIILEEIVKKFPGIISIGGRAANVENNDR